MASLSVNVKFSASIQPHATSGTGSKYPDSTSFEMTSRKRLENQVRTIAADGTLTLTKSEEGITTSNLIKIECLTAGKGFNLTFNSDANGFDVVAPSSSAHAVFIATADFTDVVITNLDDTNTIDIQFSVYEAYSA